MLSPVSQRIKDYLALRKISATEFGKRIGAGAQYVNSIKEGPSLEKLYAIAVNFPDLSLWWLLFGEGEMIKPEEAREIERYDGEMKAQQSAASAALSDGERLVYETTIRARDKQIEMLQDLLKSVVSQDPSKVG